MAPAPKPQGPPLWVWALVLPLATLGLFSLFRDAQSLISAAPNVGPTTAAAAARNTSRGLFDALDARRTWYSLDKTLPPPVTGQRIRQLVQDALQTVPSAFNSEPNRALVLLGPEHDRLWDAIAAARKATLSAEQWASSAAAKLAAHRAAAGTVLFFIDRRVVERYAADVPAYAAEFPVWARESGGMLQLAVWTALSAEGLGANLQHFNGPLAAPAAPADGGEGAAAALEAWGVRPGWEVTAQLVFGGRVGDAPPPKGKIPMSEKLVVRGEVESREL